MKMYLGTGSHVGTLAHPGYADVLREAGVKRVLYPYIHVLDGILPYEADDIMLDSGAYSAHTKGWEINLDDYILWLKTHLPKYPSLTTYVNLDSISDPQVSMENQAKMEAAGLHPLPCYHYGEPEEILEYYCSRYEYVGLGGLASRRLGIERLTTFWEHVYETYPNNVFHLFGINSMALFYKYRPYSIDSLSYIQYTRHCNLPGYYKGLPDVMDISENGIGWRFPIHWRDFAIIAARTMLDWEKLEWLANINPKAVEDKPQLKLF